MSSKKWSIVSVYSSEDSGIAFAKIEVSDREKAELTKIWTERKDNEFFSALKATEADTYRFNGTVTQDGLYNVLADAAKEEGIRPITVEKPFKYSEALTIFKSLRAKESIIQTTVAEWPRMAARMNRDGRQDSAEIMAFLQSVIAANRHMKKGQGAGFGMALGGQQERKDPYGRWQPRSAPSFRSIL